MQRRKTTEPRGSDPDAALYYLVRLAFDEISHQKAPGRDFFDKLTIPAPYTARELRI